ncbi:MAG: hypothetical protein PHN42_00215 [Bacilli bacterium]|nr:hypothetical protein [Bacilli bacterium]
MNSSLIEGLGINKLENFLLRTKKINPVINQRDKYPIWDGEILVYISECMEKKNLYCRIPVQIKSELMSDGKKDEETYSVEISDLEKYADEGGVLFIKVLYDEKKDFGYFYMKNLIKGDIRDILTETKINQKFKTIHLKEINNEKNLFTLFSNFKIHRELQMQLPKLIDNNFWKRDSTIYTFGCGNINDIVIDDQYAYAKTNLNSYAYIGKIKFDQLTRKLSIEVSTNKAKYYNVIEQKYSKKEKIIKISDYVYFDNEYKLQVKNSINRENSLRETINDLEFVLDLYINKNIKIGNGPEINFEFDNKIIIETRIKQIEADLKYLKGAANIISSLNIPIESIKVKDVVNDEKLVCNIYEIISQKNTVKFDDINSDTIINVVDVLGIVFLIYFVKKADGSYIGYNFLKDDYVYNNFSLELDETVQLSRYFGLKSDILGKIIFDSEIIISEIKNCTKNEVTIIYINNLMLEFIKAYDENHKFEYLDIARKINNILRKQREYYSESFYQINRFQILKRTKELLSENIYTLTRIKVNEKDNNVCVCCCCILLEQYEEFVIYFEQLDIETKETFKNWAIYNLIPKEINLHKYNK